MRFPVCANVLLQSGHAIIFGPPFDRPSFPGDVGVCEGKPPEEAGIEYAEKDANDPGDDTGVDSAFPCIDGGGATAVRTAAAAWKGATMALLMPAPFGCGKDAGATVANESSGIPAAVALAIAVAAVDVVVDVVAIVVVAGARNVDGAVSEPIGFKNGIMTTGIDTIAIELLGVAIVAAAALPAAGKPAFSCETEVAAAVEANPAATSAGGIAFNICTGRKPSTSAVRFAAACATVCVRPSMAGAVVARPLSSKATLLVWLLLLLL